MKHFLKKYLFFIYLYLIGLNISCETEKEFIEGTKNSNIKLEKVSLKDSEVLKNLNLMEAVSKIKIRKHNSDGKIIYDSITGIYFDDENGIKITKDEIETYTFKIIKESGKLENLIFSKNEINEFNIYKVKYDFTEEEMKYMTEIQIENSPKFFLEVIKNYNGQTQILSKLIAIIDCEIITSPRDDGDPYGPNAIEICTYHLEDDGSGGGGGNNPSGNNPGGSESGGSNSNGSDSGGSGLGGVSSDGIGSGSFGINNQNNNNIPIITSPVVHHDNPPINKTPCEILKELTDNIIIQDRIDYLKTKTTGIKEFGVKIELKYNAVDGEYQYSTSDIEGENFNTTIPVGGYTTSQAHNHPINGQSIPSWGDINWAKDCEQTIRVAFVGHNYTTNIVVVGDSEIPSNESIIYAIKIDNFDLLKEKLSNDLNSDPDVVAMSTFTDKLKAMNDKTRMLYSNVENNTAGLQQKFLEYFRNYGISLYKFDELSIKWNKLKLLNAYDPMLPNAPNSVIFEPCE